MIKNIIIKSLIIILILIIGYSIFWFFKAGQIEKQISDIVSENSSNFSISSVEVKGFPLKQKIVLTDLKISLNNSFLKNYQITFKEIEAVGKIFSSEFKAKITQIAELQNIQNNSISTVIFNSEPEISFKIANSMLKDFSYKDQGIKISDADTNEIFSFAASEIKFSSELAEDEKIINKISFNIKEVSKFDLFDIYKNSYEQKIIDGLKTGEIVLNNQIAELSNNQIDNTQNIKVETANADANKNNKEKNHQQNHEVAANQTSTNDLSVKDSSVKDSPVKDPSANDSSSASKENNLENNLGEIAENLNLDKKINIIADLEYVLNPQNQQSQQVDSVTESSESPIQDLQLQEAPIQYSKTLKVNNLEFDHGDFKISLIGQVEFFQDDTLPSGAITMKIEKINQLISDFSKKLNDNAEIRKIETSAVQISELNIAGVPTEDNINNNVAAKETEKTDVKMQLENKGKNTQENSDKQKILSTSVENNADKSSTDQANKNITNSDPYYLFLTRISSNLENVTKEISAKNQLSKDEVAVFEIRREKNLEFLINETSMREIIGKF
jgi:hypothetical protein